MPIPGGGHTAAIFSSEIWKGTGALAILTLLIVMFIMISIGLVWGFFTMVGVFLIVYAGIMFTLGKGNWSNEIGIVLIGIGIFFILLHYAGFEMAVIDFSGIAPFERIYNIWH